MGDCDFLNQKYSQQTKNRQIIGNQGLHFVSFILARQGLNTAITARNAKGADILAYNGDCSIVKTIQVKSTTSKLDVKVGQTVQKDGPRPPLLCDYWIFVDLSYAYPRCYVFTKDELQEYVLPDNNRGKDGKWSWWLSAKVIYNEASRDNWEKIKL